MRTTWITTTTAALALSAPGAVAFAGTFEDGHLHRSSIAVEHRVALTVATRQVEGTVLSVDRSTRTFRLRDSQRGTFRIKVTSRTRWERISGFSGLRGGMTNIQADLRRSNGSWVATNVERSGGGGNHGGDGGSGGRGGADDPAGHH